MSKKDRIDPVAIEALTGFLDEILTTYFATSPELFARMKVAVESGDLTSLRANAHSLKSSSALVGALDLSETCAALESSSAIDSDARDGVVKACAEFDEAVVDLQAILAEKKRASGQ